MDKPLSDADIKRRLTGVPVIKYSDLRKVKKDLLRTDNKFESDDFFHEWIKEHKPKIILKNKFPILTTRI